MKKALVLKDYREDARQILRNCGLEVVSRESPVGDEEALAEEIRGIEDLELVVVAMETITEKVISASETLKIIGRTGVGCDQIDAVSADKYGICICNSPDTSTIPVAEHVIYMLLSLSCGSTKIFKSLEQGRYGELFQMPDVLCGKTLGVIGCGRIGCCTAKYAYALGMQTIGYDPMIPVGSKKDSIEMVEQDKLWQRADFITLHMPATQSTIRSIGKKRFEMMKPGAYLINCARGALLVEEELTEALRIGTIVGVGLDVYTHEPIESDHSLLDMQQVVLSPHCADYTVQVKATGHANASRIFVELLQTGQSSCIVNHPDSQARARRWDL